MPLYEYQCTNCHHRFERIRKFSDPPLTICPQCSGSLQQLMSAPAVQFKGSGWYVTDYARKSAAPSGNGKGNSDSATKSDTKPAEASPASSSTETK